jgi:putative ABC transport system permease protein
MRLLDIEWRESPLPPAGLVVSEKLAQLLQVSVGDLVFVEVLEGQRPVFTAPITRLIKDVSGAAAYMDQSALGRLLGEGGASSGAFRHLEVSCVASSWSRAIA